MSGLLLHAIDQIGREKGIDRSILIDAIEKGIVTATKTRRGQDPNERIEAHMDVETGTISLVTVKEVVENVTDPSTEMGYGEAQIMYPDVHIGEEVEIPKEVTDLGRIGAQKAKQVILQLVRDAEREIVYSTFISKVFDIVNGTVTRAERNKVYVDIGRTEALLPGSEIIPGENYKRGDRVRCIIQEVRQNTPGPQVILSRTSPEFMKKLFEMEVPEIYDATIEIKAIVRDPGIRAKMAVISNDRNVDPVGACVGLKGSRVQAVVRELKGENIDIIPWTEDISQFITLALSPAKVKRVKVDAEDKSLAVLVDDDQLSLAIGRKGQNVRLAHKLTGWKIDIYSPTKLAEEAVDIFKETIESPFKDMPLAEIRPETTVDPFAPRPDAGVVEDESPEVVSLEEPGDEPSGAPDKGLAE